MNNVKKSIEQTGRSMIEMLGVLAIIAVLSVVGMAGYSKAMDKYRINKIMNHVGYIVSNTRTLFSSQYDAYGSLSGAASYMSSANYTNREIVNKAKIFPEEIIKSNYKNVFGGDILFFSSGKFTASDGKAFVLGFHNIPQEACLEIATQDWNSSLGLVGMKVLGSNDVCFVSSKYLGSCESECQKGCCVICARDMPMNISDAITACNTNGNYISWKFY